MPKLLSPLVGVGGTHTGPLVGTATIDAGGGFRHGDDTKPSWTVGSGSPEGVVAAPVGSLYSRTDGGTDTTIYRKESGAAATGWVATAAGASGDVVSSVDGRTGTVILSDLYVNVAGDTMTGALTVPNAVSTQTNPSATAYAGTPALSVSNTNTTTNNWSELAFVSGATTRTTAMGGGIALKNLDTTNGYGEFWLHSRSAAGLLPRLRIPEVGGLNIYGDTGVVVACADQSGTVRASNSQTSATLGTSLLTNGNFATDLSGWTTTAGWSWATGALHTIGNTGTLSQTANGVANASYYYIAYTITGRTAGSVTFALGSVVSSSASATGSATLLANAANPTFTITPTTDFDGTITSVSVQLVGLSTPHIALDSTILTPVAELRASGTSIGVGFEAASSTIGSPNTTAIGHQALKRNTTGTANTGVGYKALSVVTTGASNAAVGSNSGSILTTGSGNTVFGANALNAVTTANYNTAIGNSALNVATGSGNVAVGEMSLASVTTGVNVGFGQRAGYSPAGLSANATTTGTRQTLLGHMTGQSVATQLNDIVAVGYYSTAGGNNAIAIGSGTNANAAGAVAIGKDSAGTSAVASTANDFVLGTSLHAVKVAGTLATSVLSVTGLTGATAASRYVGGTATGAPVTGTFAVGDYVVTNDGGVYVCASAGTPGTWKAVGGVTSVDGRTGVVTLTDLYLSLPNGGTVAGPTSFTNTAGLTIETPLTVNKSGTARAKLFADANGNIGLSSAVVTTSTGTNNVFIGQSVATSPVPLTAASNVLLGYGTNLNAAGDGVGVAIGNGAKTGSTAVSVGSLAAGLGGYSVAIGGGATVPYVASSYGIAIGYNADGATSSVALGATAQATAGYSIAIGSGASATGTGAVAIGKDSAGLAAATSVQDAFILGTWRHAVSVAGTFYCGNVIDTAQAGGFRFGAVGQPQWTKGAASPEGAVTAPVGSIYSRTGGGTDTTFYRKESGTGNTGWVPVVAPPVSSVDGRTGVITLTDKYLALAGGTLTGNLGLGQASPTAKLQFTAATNAAGGILFGTDTTLYRSAADTLTTDDSLQALNFRQGASGPLWSSGTGTPEGAVTAPVGSMYSRTDGSTDTALYRKETGVGNTGWVATAAAAAGGVTSVDGRTGAVVLSDLYVNVAGDTMTSPLTVPTVLAIQTTASTSPLSTSPLTALFLQNTNATTNNWTDIAMYGNNGSVIAGGVSLKNLNHTNAYGELWFHSRSAAGLYPRLRLPQTGGAEIYGDTGTVSSSIAATGAHRPASSQTLAPLGADVLVNGAFTSDLSGWTTTANWTWVTGTAKHTTGNTDVMSQDLTGLTNLGYYQITYTITGRTAGSVTISLGSNSLTVSSSSNQTILNSGTTGTFAITPTTDFDGAIDLVSLQLISASTPQVYLDGSPGSAMAEMRAASNHLGLGLNALSQMISTTSYTTAVGTNAMRRATGGYQSVAFGYGALSTTTYPSACTAVGYNAMTALTSGPGNTAVGSSALAATTTGQSNVAVGNNSLNAVTTGSSNTGVGAYSAWKVTTGSDVTAIGNNSLNNVTGDGNTAVGSSTMSSLTTGTYNTAVGEGALSGVTSGDNVAVGRRAGSSPNGVAANYTSTGTRQTLLGTQTGNTSTTQINDVVALGWRALVGGNNAIAIGSGASANAAGAVVIGKDSSGTAASTTTANDFVLGTANHTVRIPGTLTTFGTTTAAIGYRNGSATGPLWSSGTGSPEGVVTAPIGSIFSRTDGSTNTSIYRKESGTGSTGWIAASAGVVGVGITTIQAITASAYDALPVKDPQTYYVITAG